MGVGRQVTVPVLWISRHPDILARGYADQGLLERLFSGHIWRTPNPPTFEHHEVHGDDWPDVDGAVVVLPARHHASDDDVAWFLSRLDALSWSLVILAGDEEWSFPWERITETETRRVWTMQPIPAHASLSFMIPGGWYPGTAEFFDSIEDGEREHEWMFAGQVTHERRQLCAAILRTMPGGYLHETQGYLQGIAPDLYWFNMARSKFVPSPSGPCTVDTARTFEALEAGCVPIVDALRPGDVDQFSYFDLLFGDGHPLIALREWGDLPNLVRTLGFDWPHQAAECSAMWQQWKRKAAHKLRDDVSGVRRTVIGPDDDPNDAITVVMPTSPIPSHPSTAIIEETIASIREQLPDCEIIIVADGVRPEQSDQADSYSEYLRRLTVLCERKWRNVLPVIQSEWGHQANVTRRALEFVTTPLLLFVEHDTPILPPVDWPGLCRVVRSGEANVIRLHHETTILPVHESVMCGAIERVDGVPLRKTSAFWARPHLSSLRFYQERVMPNFSESSRTMIEDRMYGIVHSAISDDRAAWWDFRIFIYTPPEHGVIGFKRSTHLDGRDGADKYEMQFS